MDGPPFYKEDIIPEDLASDLHADSGVFHQPCANGEQIVIFCVCVILDGGLGDGQSHSQGLQLSIGEAHGAQQFIAGAFEKDEIIPVVDKAHLVCVRVGNPILHNSFCHPGDSGMQKSPPEARFQHFGGASFGGETARPSSGKAAADGYGNSVAYTPSLEVRASSPRERLKVEVYPLSGMMRSWMVSRIQPICGKNLDSSSAAGETQLRLPTTAMGASR